MEYFCLITALLISFIHYSGRFDFNHSIFKFRDLPKKDIELVITFNETRKKTYLRFQPKKYCVLVRTGDKQFLIS